MKTIKKSLKVFLIVLLLGVLISCQEAEYTVKIDPKNETEIVEKTVKENETINEPTTPTKDGYVFVGWFVDGEVYDFSKEVKENLTIVAVWEKGYTVTFNYNYDNKIETVAVEVGSLLDPLDVVERVGYEFQGWYKDDIFFKEWDFSTDILEEDDLTLYAKWDSVPVINGISDITYLIGDGELDLLEGVSATDFNDGELEVTLDEGNLDLTKEGVYEVTYSAKNFPGKTTVEVIEVTVMYENRLLIKETEENQELLLQVEDDVLGFIIEISYMGEVNEDEVIVTLENLLSEWHTDIYISNKTINIAATGLNQIDVYQLTKILTVSNNVTLELVSLEVDTVNQTNLIIK